MDSSGKAAVVGGGSWGTAIASLLARNGADTILWAREPEVSDQVNRTHLNEVFLPGIPLPPQLRATSVLKDALTDAEAVVFVTPAQHTAAILEEVAPYLPQSALVVTATKGIEVSTLRRMDEVFRDVLGEAAHERLLVLSGPSFAAEVAKEAPTAVVLASLSDESRRLGQDLFTSDYFRTYTSDDVVGVEVAGALKNVIAVATGIALGLGFGHNTSAALITRGLAEIRRLGIALGARSETFGGLAGMGDLILTCTGDLSRNRSVGYRIGSGEPMESVLAGGPTVAEGVPTAGAACRLAAAHRVDMPITQEVNAILYEGSSPLEALRNLMSRDPKTEEWG